MINVLRQGLETINVALSYQLIYFMCCACGSSILGFLHRSYCKKCLEKSSKQCRHLLTKIPSCSICWSIVSLALQTASVPMILCFLIPSSIFLNSRCQMNRLQSKNWLILLIGCVPLPCGKHKKKRNVPVVGIASI